MRKNVKILMGVLSFLLLVALVYGIPTILQATQPQVCYEEGKCTHEERLNFITMLIPVFIIAGFALGAVGYYFFSERKEPARIVIKPDTPALLAMLGRDEKLVVDKIILEKGKVMQSEISRIEGLGKVKAHRVLQRLERRGVVIKEESGKTNIIRLNKDLEKTFL